MAQNSVVSLASVNSPAGTLEGDALVIGVVKGSDGPVLFESPLDAAETAALNDSLTTLGVSGNIDSLHRLPAPAEVKAKILVLAGLGAVQDGAPNAEALRKTAGSAVRQLAGLDTVVIALPAADAAQLAAVAEGAALGAYRYAARRSGDDSAKQSVQNVIISSAINTRAAKTILNRAAVVGKAVNATRTLVNEPPSRLYPETFAEAAKELAKGLPVKVTVWDEKKLEKDGFGGILGVGQGSSRPPRLVKVEYSPARAKKHIALVGKGITFDSGGISLKPAASMMTMKCDMAGAASILTAALAAAELGLPVKVTAWLCIAENMPSATATRPSDVITIFGGKTVEVLNTDAEGRLVMADGLAIASTEHPDVLLDVATLTGAQVIALGNRTSAVMGDEQLSNSVKEAADKSGELFWTMPIPDELRPSLDSPVADLANIGEKAGGMMTAAAFLAEFVGSAKSGAKIPWAHLDIAGPAFNESAPYGYTPKHATGVAVRTLLSFAEGVAAGK
ncbi:cytosol aminopeptidase [Renibacterium salmoninarum ATCC 33209]|uniref:Probable cytosol aminopeptidase n=1 Tax=Renibacterium salmoninarum (strain ATCC 33209 / DSM 20767 / JCM 11484 / NBRC 15589 / NCIMB 2235) TaxID=288705 RepID=A9WS27_RENSM|nr:leucyl aminopeptidase [Renibacterium salmoninarum]ABY24156.1 cytosol aminopeptidase [Renibacterium salmoninarum ATCC 33209]